MKPIPFKGQNIVFGEDQPQYQPLPALMIDDTEATVITCWELSDEEIEELVKNKCFYLKQLRFRYMNTNGMLQPMALQPILPMVNLGDDIDLRS